MKSSAWTDPFLLCGLILGICIPPLLGRIMVFVCGPGRSRRPDALDGVLAGHIVVWRRLAACCVPERGRFLARAVC